MPLPDAQAKPRAGVKLKPLGLKSVVDRGPVTEEEIERTHDRIRSHMKSRASTFRQNFKRYDSDNSGAINFHEAEQMIMKLNLHDVRPACLKEIFKVADTDGSGELDFTEFCTLIMAEDALPMAKARRRASRFEGGPWHPQGGRTMSTLAVTMRQSNSAQRLHSASDRLSTSPSMQSLTAIPMQSTFIKGKPFDRNMWVERSRMRRQEEQLATHQPLLRTFASSKIQQMSYEEGMVAIKFYKDGGDAWKDWSRVHWKTRQPTSKPQIPRSVSMGVL